MGLTRVEGERRSPGWGDRLRGSERSDRRIDPVPGPDHTVGHRLVHGAIERLAPHHVGTRTSGGDLSARLPGLVGPLDAGMSWAVLRDEHTSAAGMTGERLHCCRFPSSDEPRLGTAMCAATQLFSPAGQTEFYRTPGDFSSRGETGFTRRVAGANPVSARQPGSSRGMRTRKVEPTPCSDSTSTFPPCAATSAATIDRPRPLPPDARVREASAR